MKNSHLKIAAVVAAMAVIAPAGAIAKPGNKPEKTDKPAKPPKKPKTVSVNLKGTVTANDGTTVTVTVDKASGQAKACKGKSLSFTTSKVHVADNDADGDQDLSDVLVGHQVKVQAKAPKGGKGTCGVPEGSAFPAKQIHDRTTPAPDEDEQDEEEQEEEPVTQPEVPAAV